MNKTKFLLRLENRRMDNIDYVEMTDRYLKFNSTFMENISKDSGIYDNPLSTSIMSERCDIDDKWLTSEAEDTNIYAADFIDQLREYGGPILAEIGKYYDHKDHVIIILLKLMDDQARIIETQNIIVQEIGTLKDMIMYGPPIPCYREAEQNFSNICTSVEK
jgi:hypothetical protein